MTSPIDSNEVFGLLTVQYTYRFIGKARAGDAGVYDMTKLEDVKRAYIDNSKRRSKSVSEHVEHDTVTNLTQPQTSDDMS